MERTKKPEKLSQQMKKRSEKPIIKKDEYDGDFGTVISTGSTLLDLAISGGRVHGGGLPGGILVEAFGPSGSGKTILLSEIAGSVQRQKGEIMFHDPEARLNRRFAKLFGLELNDKDYFRSNTVPEVFSSVRDWEVENDKVIHGVFADSLAALSTDMEMEGKDGDKMGMRRAKEFSEELRKTCRILALKNYLMVCSNQVRVNIDPRSFQKYTTPGGESVGFYSSLRLRFNKPEKITNKIKVAGKEVKRVSGVKVEIEVFKSSIWKPFHTAPVTILFDYGIDNIKDCLQFIKDYTSNNVYTLGGNKLSVSMDEAVEIVEVGDLEPKVKEETISLWEEIESKFKIERKAKR